MAARRGLNKGRGLSSLIPQKIKSSEEEDGNTTVQSVETEKTEHSKSEENVNFIEVESIEEEKHEASKKKIKKNETSSSENSAEDNNKEKNQEQQRKKEHKKEVKTEENPETKENGVRRVRISDVIPNDEQPRKSFNEETIDELADSIREYGILQPLLVKQKGKYYEIVAGERRWRAAKKADLKEIPVIIGNYSDNETLEISLIENIQREDLNPIEEAEAYQTLIQELHLTQDEAAKKVGKSRASVTNSLRLLKLASPVREMLISGQITMGHARALLAIEDQDMQVMAAEQVVAGNFSVRDTEKLVKILLNPPKEKKEKEHDEQKELAYHALEEQMTRKTGTKVTIHAKGEKGKIEIDYYSQNDLERIIDLIG